MSRENERARRRRLARGFRPFLEELENRLAPAAAFTNFHIVPDAGGGSPSGNSPLQILEAYGFYNYVNGTNNISFNNVAGNGAGQTIAIVDAYNDPNIASDLAAFDAQYSLPAPASFSVLNQNGSTSSLPASNNSWAVEESLDVEWAHALAPGAGIVLVESSSASIASLDTAVATAASLPGVSAVSMSWSGGEFNGETSDDSIFTTPSNHQGVTFLAATGDSGSPSGYPAYSSNVVAVGGTDLYTNSNGSYSSETAWSDSGGGTSSFEAEPAYQDSVQSTGKRTVPDVSFDADPNTGVAIYDSYQDPYGGPWVEVGGTSVATPCWAAIIAITNQGRVAEGGTTLNGAAQTLPGLYSLPSTDFHDITSGSNGGFSAGKGYDEVTGIGTPIVNNLVSGLVAYANVSVPHVVISSAPTSVGAGSPFGFTATVEIGNTVDAAFNGSLTVSLLNNPGGSTLSGGSNLTATASGGVATFSGLSLNIADPGYTLQVAGTGVASGTSSSFSVVAGTATQIVEVIQPPGSVGQNAPFSALFAIEDANGNVVTSDNSDSVTVSFATNTNSATLGGTTTTTVVNGVATFSNLSVNQLGSGYTLQATNGTFTSIASNPFTVTSGPTFAIYTQPPTTVGTGETFGAVVEVLNPGGTLDTSYTGKVTIALASNTGGATLGGTLTVSVVNGLATFTNLTISKVGTGYTLQATSVSAPTITSPVTNPINVVTPATKLVITTEPPTSVGANTAFTFNVSVENANGVVITGYNGTVSVQISGNPLGGTVSVKVVNGVASFSVSLSRAGSYKLVASSSGLTSATTTSISVTAAAARFSAFER